MSSPLGRTEGAIFNGDSRISLASKPSDNESYRTSRTGQTSRTIRTSWQVLHLISPYTLVPFADLSDLSDLSTLSDKVLAEMHHAYLARAWCCSWRAFWIISCWSCGEWLACRRGMYSASRASNCCARPVPSGR